MVDAVGKCRTVEIRVFGHIIPTVVHVVFGCSGTREVEHMLHRQPFASLESAICRHLIIIYKVRGGCTQRKVAPPVHSVYGGHTKCLHLVIVHEAEREFLAECCTVFYMKVYSHYVYGL